MFSRIFRAKFHGTQGRRRENNSHMRRKVATFDYVYEHVVHL